MAGWESTRLKELDKENTRLKKLVADQALDNAILKDVAKEWVNYKVKTPV